MKGEGEMDNSVYVAHGYENRKDYLNNLADEFGVPRKVVYSMASILGSNEDFDGLVTELEDCADMFQEED